MKYYGGFVYIMASRSGTLYIGVTNDVERRVCEHKTGFNKGFTKKYECNKLVYVEVHESIIEAIVREKEIKGWKRMKKEALIRSQNPGWFDLASGDCFRVKPHPSWALWTKSVAKTLISSLVLAEI